MPGSQRELKEALRKVLRSWGIKRVNLGALSDALGAGNLDLVVSLLGVNSESLGPVLESLQSAYIQYGQAVLNQLPRGIVGQVGFGFTNPKVLEYIRQTDMNLIQGLVQEQREIIRQVIYEVAETRSSPRKAIRLLAGKVGPTGVRTGSVVGLSEPQFRYVVNMREELSDLSKINSYFSRQRRDKNLDGIVRRAIAEGRALNESEIDRISARYTDRLLDLRAETIARTEHHAAVEGSRQSSIEHLVESGGVEEQDVKRFWDATGDRKTRPDHLSMDGTGVGLKEPLTAPDGARLMFPGDRSLGAGAKHTANCRCTVRIEIDYYRGLK